MKMNLGVVFGGKSVEHEISIVTAMQAMAAADRDRYQIMPIYITKDGAWYHGSGMEQIENYYNIPKLLAQARRVAVAMQGDRYQLILQKNHFWQREQVINLDVVLPIMHGSCGEDGSLQGLLEMFGMPYVSTYTHEALQPPRSPFAAYTFKQYATNIIPHFHYSAFCIESY